MSREIIENDLNETLTAWINRNKESLLDIVVSSFKLSMNDMIKSQVTNCLRYYSAQVANSIDGTLNNRVMEIIKDSFGDELKIEAQKAVDARVKTEQLNEKVEEMIEIALEKDLKRFMQREIKARISEMVNNKELKITI